MAGASNPIDEAVSKLIAYRQNSRQLADSLKDRAAVLTNTWNRELARIVQEAHTSLQRAGGNLKFEHPDYGSGPNGALVGTFICVHMSKSSDQGWSIVGKLRLVLTDTADLEIEPVHGISATVPWPADNVFPEHAVHEAFAASILG